MLKFQKFWLLLATIIWWIIFSLLLLLMCEIFRPHVFQGLHLKEASNCIPIHVPTDEFNIAHRSSLVCKLGVGNLAARIVMSVNSMLNNATTLNLFLLSSQSNALNITWVLNTHQIKLNQIKHDLCEFRSLWPILVI